MTVGSLFAGIGGLDLGLERAGFTVRWQVEIDDFCNRVLAKHWPDVARFRDVRDVGAHNLERVDLIAGGFPCQDISVAGRGAGLHGSRSALWFELLRVVQELRPRWVLAENVPALRTRGIDVVLDGLGAAGYAAWPLVVGARHVGAPHRRDRVWIIASAGTPQPGKHPDFSRAVADTEGCRRTLEGERRATEHTEPRAASTRLADSDRDGLREQRSGGLLDGERAASGHDADGRSGARAVGDADRRGLRKQPRRFCWACGSDSPFPARPGHQHEWEEPRVVYSARGEVGPAGLARQDATRAPRPIESPLGGAAHGLPGRLAGRHRRASLKALGNAVVPQVAEAIGRAIMRAAEVA